MRTAEQIINNLWQNAPYEDRVFSSVLIEEAMKAYAQEACREQREICARPFAAEYHDAIKNAPSPEMK